MRGKAPAARLLLLAAGITPAYAGKRPRCGARVCKGWDHPRVCGEKPCSQGCCFLRVGSPPRMRGKVCVVAWCSVSAGITPAYAGKSMHRVTRNIGEEDHPRVCGEKTLMRLVRFAVLGSPPRMRGKAMFFTAPAMLPRITPAYAGKSCSPYLWQTGRRDHPRVCGEKCTAGRHVFHDLGSPPRMRGKVIHPLILNVKIGITPAYAGKRASAPSTRPLSRDHPRVCGEKIMRHLKYVTCTGSPPRMRGKAAFQRSFCQNNRITPAYAGKSSRSNPIS